MKLAVAVLAVAACRGDNPGKVDSVGVYAFAGDSDPEGGATVLSHRANGDPLAGATADAVGSAQIPIEVGGTITVVFPGNVSSLTPVISLVTVPAPPAGSELDVHGPPHPRTASAAGLLLVSPPAMTADSYTIDLGCTVSQVTGLPASINVSSLCLGSDANLDVLVTAHTGGAVVAYAAGRVELVDAFAMFEPAAWDTTTPTVAITSAGVTANLTWSLRADGLRFATQAVTTDAPVYTGLTIDGATLVAATAAGQVTTRDIDGAPAAIAIDTSDFLPAVTWSGAFDGARAFTWSPVDVGADAANLHLEYAGPTAQVVWDVLTPPDSAGCTIPVLGDELNALVARPDTSTPATLQYVQAAIPEGFDALVAGGLYYESSTGPSTVARRATNGELRASLAHGP
jgi:hypothetical protein